MGEYNCMIKLIIVILFLEIFQSALVYTLNLQADSFCPRIHGLTRINGTKEREQLKSFYNKKSSKSQRFGGFRF